MGDLLWVSVPGGRLPSGEALLRVLVVPRPDPETPLDQQGLGAWPPSELTQDGASAAQLSVVFGASVDDQHDVPIVATPQLDVRPGAWEAFFSTLSVRIPAFEDRPIDSVATVEHANLVNETYRSSARALAGIPLTPEEESARGRVRDLPSRRPSPPPRSANEDRAARTVDAVLTLSLLREHPAVLRALGLVFDLVFDPSPLPERGVIKVAWGGRPDSVPSVVSPWTAYRRDAFLARPAGRSDIHDGGGMVTVGRPEWSLHTIDADLAIGRLSDAQNEDGTAPATMPALRTAGILLAKAGRVSELEARRERRGRAARRADDDARRVLFADDLVLGYRIDVKPDGETTWSSLCERIADYRVNDVLIAQELPEEGHVKIAAGIDHGDLRLRADEIVARWDGWSLAAPRPALRGRGPVRREPAGLPFDFEVGLRPTSLPKLRFGRSYALRARVADMAGGGLLVDQPTLDGCETDSTSFSRHDPVLPPDVRLPDGVGPGGFGPGASLRRLVIRAAEGIADAVVDTSRVLAPPTASFEVVERHGRFEGDPVTTVDLLRRPELPDPAAGGVTAFVAPQPGSPFDELEKSNWRAAESAGDQEQPWPDLAVKRLRLQARAAGEPPVTVHWDTDDDLVVRLAPAEQLTLELSSFPAPDLLHHFTVHGWVSGSPVNVDQLMKDGRHPMLTPVDRLTLVHAVHRQEGRPGGTLTATRDEGETCATISPTGLLGVDPSRTGVLGVRATWHPADDPSDPGATDRPVDDIVVPRGATDISPFRHEFGDTKHRRVTYALRAESRFRDCFPSDIDVDAFHQDGASTEVIVPSSARPVPPVVLAATPAFVWSDDAPGFGVIRTRRSHGIRVELASPWFTTGDGEQLAVVVDNGATTLTSSSFISRIGRDPAWQTPDPGVFAPVSGDRRSARLAELDLTVSIVPREVWRADGRWYADVAVDPIRSYSPFVQLVVARFQPHSLAGLELSRVVMTDFVPLLPDRSLTVDLGAGGGIDVVLEGLGPDGPQQNSVTVILEHRTAQPVPGEVTTLGSSDDDKGLWAPIATETGGLGELFTLARPDETTRLRIRVHETENIVTAPREASDAPAEILQRNVFATTVAVPPP